MTVDPESPSCSTDPRRGPGFLWVAGLLLALVLGCGEGESELFDPGSSRDLDAPLDTLDHLPLSLDRSYRARGESGDRSVLLLAREGDLVSTVYLRYSLADLPDTASIVEGRLSFRVNGGSADPVRMQLFEVAPEAPDWAEGDLPLDPLPLVEPFLDLQTTPVQGSPGSDLDLSQILSVPAELLRRWKNDPASNRGLALRLGEESRGFLVVYSSEAVITDTDSSGTSVSIKTPELVVQRTDQDYTFEPDDDAYLVEDGGTPEDGAATTLLLEQLVPHRALLFPDLSGTGLRPGDTIHKAELFLQVVPGTFPDTLDLSVGLYRALAPWTEEVEPDTVARETFATDVVTVTAESDSLRFDFAPHVQRWVDGHDEFGLTLRIIGEGSDDGRFRIFSREAPAGSAPYFRVIASRAPDPRWEQP